MTVAPFTVGLCTGVLSWTIACIRARTSGLTLHPFDPTALTIACAPLMPILFLVRAGEERIAVIMAILGVCAASDYRTGYVFDHVIACGVIGLFIAAWLERALLPVCIGGFCGYATLSLVRFVTRGRGIGLGDVKLAAIVGALGVREGLGSIGCAFVVGAVAAIFLLVNGRARFGDTLPFAPCLAAGACLIVYGGLL